MDPKIIVSRNPEALSVRAAKLFVTLAKQTIKKTGRFTVVLSGGSTPEKLFRVLASSRFKSRIDWKKVYFFFGDERCVSPRNKLSNYRMAHKTLFSKVPVPSKNIFRIKGELPPARAAREYEKKITRLEGKILHFAQDDKENEMPIFDLIFLGLGTDGHTASLFPKTRALREKKRIAVPNIAKGTACLHRVTLTFPVLNSAKTVCFLVSGKDKTEVFQDILKRRKKYPALSVKPRGGQLIWMIDAPARRG
jgi:6-phosphogluconolactonase